MSYDTLVKGGHVVLPDYGIRQVDLAINGEHIAAIVEPGTPIEAVKTIDATGLHVLPGAIDTHTHWGYKGDFGIQCESDSRAAAIGGVTTALLLQKMEPGQFPELKQIGEERSLVDFIFSPAITSEETAAFIEESIEQWGCPSFKFYLAYRDIPGALPGDDWNRLTDGLMVEAMEKMAQYEGTLACVHAENADIINRSIARANRSEKDGLAEWEKYNPGFAEVEAIHRSALFAEHAGIPLYIVHMSGRDAINALRRAKTHWPKIYGETCPHYLYHTAERSSSVVKFSPPVRHQVDNEALWEALATGLIDCVGSDNSPTLSDVKQGSVWDITRGGPGAGTILPFMLSEGFHKKRLSLERVVEVTSTNGAKIFGLYPKKGAIQIGSDADLAIVDLNLEKTISPTLLGTWSDYNQYTDITFRGWPVITMIRGQEVVVDGKPCQERGYGKFLPRTHARQKSVTR